MPNKDLRLKDSIVLFDRDFGLSIFQNFRGYNNLEDDAEWLLERTPQKSRGFIIRPVNSSGRDGIWIGEYNYNGIGILDEDTILDRDAALLSKTILDYAAHKISEKKIMKKLAIDMLKEKIRSRIVQDFKYYICPVDRLYSCVDVGKVYEALREKFGKGRKVPYQRVAEEITKIRACDVVVVCPLMVPNHFERILNLSKALKGRKLGEIKIVSPSMVEIV